MAWTIERILTAIINIIKCHSLGITRRPLLSSTLAWPLSSLYSSKLNRQTFVLVLIQQSAKFSNYLFWHAHENLERKFDTAGFAR